MVVVRDDNTRGDRNMDTVTKNEEEFAFMDDNDYIRITMTHAVADQLRADLVAVVFYGARDPKVLPAMDRLMALARALKEAT